MVEIINKRADADSLPKLEFTSKDFEDLQVPSINGNIEFYPIGALIGLSRITRDTVRGNKYQHRVHEVRGGIDRSIAPSDSLTATLVDSLDRLTLLNEPLVNLELQIHTRDYYGVHRLYQLTNKGKAVADQVESDVSRRAKKGLCYGDTSFQILSKRCIQKIAEPDLAINFVKLNRSVANLEGFEEILPGVLRPNHEKDLELLSISRHATLYHGPLPSGSVVPWPDTDMCWFIEDDKLLHVSEESVLGESMRYQKR